MKVVTCDTSYNDAWEAFVRTSDRASFYHRIFWRDVIERSFGHRTAYLAAVDDGHIVGIFPLVQLKSALFGNIACSLPFLNYAGPCAIDANVEQALLEAAERVADDWRVDYLEIRSRFNLGERYPFSGHKVSMTVDLDPDPDKLWGKFKTGQRQEIRRAYKNGFTARFGAGELVDDFYAVLSESWRDLGTPIFSKTFLNHIRAACPDISLCLVYDGDGIPAAGAFVGLHQGTVEGMWLGVRSNYRRQLVGYVLYWELIKHACETGFQQFHLGRSSSDTGAEQFKKKWNATGVQLYWHYVLRTRSEIPQLNVANKKFHLAMAAWRRLPMAAVRRIGPMIARSIP